MDVDSLLDKPTQWQTYKVLVLSIVTSFAIHLLVVTLIEPSAFSTLEAMPKTTTVEVLLSKPVLPNSQSPPTEPKTVETTSPSMAETLENPSSGNPADQPSDGVFKKALPSESEAPTPTQKSRAHRYAQSSSLTKLSETSTNHESKTAVVSDRKSVSSGQLLSQLKSMDFTDPDSSTRFTCTKAMQASEISQCQESNLGLQTPSAGVAIRQKNLRVSSSPAITGINLKQRNQIMDQLAALEAFEGDTSVDQEQLYQSRKALTEKINHIDAQQAPLGLITIPVRSAVKLWNELKPPEHYSSEDK